MQYNMWKSTNHTANNQILIHFKDGTIQTLQI